MDKRLPYYTSGGSFWCNDISTLDVEHAINCSCKMVDDLFNSSSYQSLALIPLKSSDDQAIGLLQLADERQGYFTKDFINFIESIGNSINIVFTLSSFETLVNENRIYKNISIMAKQTWQEINQPMTAILSYVETLSSTLNTDDIYVKQLLESIHHETQKMNIIINKLKNFSSHI